MNACAIDFPAFTPDSLTFLKSPSAKAVIASLKNPSVFITPLILFRIAFFNVPANSPNLEFETLPNADSIPSATFTDNSTKIENPALTKAVPFSNNRAPLSDDLKALPNAAKAPTIKVKNKTIGLANNTRKLFPIAFTLPMKPPLAASALFKASS